MRHLVGHIGAGYIVLLQRNANKMNLIIITLRNRLSYYFILWLISGKRRTEYEILYYIQSTVCYKYWGGQVRKKALQRVYILPVSFVFGHFKFVIQLYADSEWFMLSIVQWERSVHTLSFFMWEAYSKFSESLHNHKFLWVIYRIPIITV